MINFLNPIIGLASEVVGGVIDTRKAKAKQKSVSKEKTVETLPETDSSSEYESDSEGSEEGSQNSHIVARCPPLIYQLSHSPSWVLCA